MDWEEPPLFDENGEPTEPFETRAERLRREAAAREEAIRQAGDNAEPTWKDWAHKALYELALGQPFLISDDIWDGIARIAPEAETPEGRAMGAVVRHGQKEGWIKASGRFVASARKGCHSNLVAEWESLIYVDPGF